MSGSPGAIHFAVDFGAATAFTWATADLIAALLRLGVDVTVPAGVPATRTLGADHRRMLRARQRRHPATDAQVKWSHYWPQCMRQALAGAVNAEFYCVNYRFRPARGPRDYWSRHVQLNGYHKLPVAQFNLAALRDLGIPESECATVPLGYSPEIPALFPDGRPPTGQRPDLHLLLVTNSHDLYRYGTDLAMAALAEVAGPGDPLVVHIKDYGGSSGSPQIRRWIAEQRRFPRVEWHNEFVSKPDLLRLYAGMDLLLAPFRGEGFSMKIVDAMALGLPVMMPAFGGPCDYAAPGGFVPIDHDEVPVGTCYDRDRYYLADDVYWCQARPAALVAALRAALEQRAGLAAVGAAARAHVLPRCSWDEAARKLIAALQARAARREAVVKPRRRPATLPVSVLIPTRDRIDALGRTLAAYGRQALPARDYELILVNDHGDPAALQALAQRHAAQVPLRVLENTGPGGPAAARNLGIGEARGEILLITGDDIVPDPQFLAAHLAGHRRFPDPRTALVGLTHWHPDLGPSPFYDLLVGPTGQQFNYGGMKHGRVTVFNRLYTSNCSLKRAWLIEEEELFSTRYPFAAFEDVELAYRLHLRGMTLRFWSTAIGYHLHAMTPASFAARQRKAGRMLTLLALQRPAFVPDEHAGYLRAFEFLRASPALAATLPETPAAWDGLADSLVGAYQQLLDLAGPLSGPAMPRPVAEQDRANWRPWVVRQGGLVWEAANQLALRAGMAEEWADGDEALARQARNWALLLTLPRVTGPTAAYWKMPAAPPALPSVLFPRSRLAFKLSCWLRDAPGMGYLVKLAEQSPLGQRLRALLLRRLRQAREA